MGEIKVATETESKGTAGGRLGKYALFAVIVAGAGTGGVFGYRHYQEISRDDQAFQTARAGGSVDHYNAYLRQYPQGRHTVEANEGIDDAVWKTIPRTVGGLGTYLHRFPNGLHATEAQESLDELAWKQATDQGTFAAYDSYAQSPPAAMPATPRRRSRRWPPAAPAMPGRTGSAERRRRRPGPVGRGLEHLQQQAGHPISNTYQRQQRHHHYHDGVCTSRQHPVGYRIKNNSLFRSITRWWARCPIGPRPGPSGGGVGPGSAPRRQRQSKTPTI